MNYQDKIDSIDSQIKKETQKLNRENLKASFQKFKARKLDAHQKILLGGLVKKAKIDFLPKNVLLGFFLDGLIKLQDTSYYEYCKNLGSKEFEKIHENKV